MIIWVTGFPGVGKTKFLRKHIQGTYWNYVQLDKIRNRLLKDSVSFEYYEESAHKSYKEFTFEEIYSNSDYYICYQNKIADIIFQNVHRNIEKMRQDNIWVVECSPIFLKYSTSNDKKVWIDTANSILVRNLSIKCQVSKKVSENIANMMYSIKTYLINTTKPDIMLTIQ